MVPDSKTIFLSFPSQNVTSSRAGRQDVSYMKLIFMKPFIYERFRVMNFMKYDSYQSSFVVESCFYFLRKFQKTDISIVGILLDM